MPVITEYIEVEDAIFLETIEWAFMEQTLSEAKRAEYAANGYPTIELAGRPYGYIEVNINGRDYKCIQGSRPKSGITTVE
jgi:hypothetical protein